MLNQWNVRRATAVIIIRNQSGIVDYLCHGYGLPHRIR